MARALIGGLVARGQASKALSVVEISPEARATVAARFGVATFAGSRSRGRHPRRCDRDRGQAAARAGRRARACDAAQAPGRPDHRRRNSSGRSVALAARLSAPGARDAQYAGADRRRHRRHVCAVGRRRRRAGRARRPSSRRSARRCGASARTSSTPSRRCRAAGRPTSSIFSRRSSRRRGELGFAPAEARRLAYATFSGSMRLAEQSESEPALLRAQVTSKGGTTERAIGDAGRGRGDGRDHRRGRSAAAERARRDGRAFRIGTLTRASLTMLNDALRFLVNIVVRADRVFGAAALHHAVAARAVSQSAGAGGRRADRLGGQAAAQGAARLPRLRLGVAVVRVARAAAVARCRWPRSAAQRCRARWRRRWPRWR